MLLAAHLLSDADADIRVTLIEKRPAFESYWKRVTSRPAYARARELDDALMPPQKAER